MIFHGLPAGLTVLCLAALAQAQGVCFHPNGYLSDDVPCRDPSAGTTMCCSSKAACLSSGLCRDISPATNLTSTRKFMRATCTDPSWSSNQCPQFCVPDRAVNGTRADFFNLNLSQNDIYIRQCDVPGFQQTARFCCGYADERAKCCDTPSSFFQLSAVPSPKNPAVVNNPQDCFTPSTASSTPPASSTPLASSTPSAPSEIPPAQQQSVTVTLSSSEPCTEPTSAPTPKTPVLSSISISTGTSVPTTTDTKAPSTSPPSSASSLSAPASSTDPDPSLLPPTSSSTSSATPTTRPSAAATALADTTDDTTDDQSSGTASKSREPNESPHRTQRLSTGAVVGIGLGASVAGAGLVTILVYLLARRRLYKKQQKRWKEEMFMRAMQGSPEPPLGGAGGMAQAEGRPPMVMLTRQGTWGSDAGLMGGDFGTGTDTIKGKGTGMGTLPPLQTAIVGAGPPGAGGTTSSGGPSPSNSWLREMGWETSPTSSSLYSSGQETRMPSMINGGVAGGGERGVKTATWLRKNSIYEMP